MYLFDCYYVLHLLVELMSNKKILHLTFWGIAKLSSNISSNISVAEIFYGPTSNVWEFHFLQILVIIYFLIVFIIAILVGGKWYFIVLLICISWWYVIFKPFHISFGHLYISFKKNVYSDPLPILNPVFVCLFFWYWAVLSFYILNIYSLSDILFANIFSH